MDMRSIIDRLVSVMEAEVTDTEKEKETKEDKELKIAVPFERLVSLIFKEDNENVGRIALRKILRGDSTRLTLREKSIVADGLINLLPIFANDRTIFNRMERKAKEAGAA